MKELIIFFIMSCICIPINYTISIQNKNTDSKPKIAIIGAGIGGTSCALFLRDLLKDKIEIHIYESNTIGGRLASITDNRTNFDIGRVFSEKDKYTNELIGRFGLTKNRPLPLHTSRGEKIFKPISKSNHKFLEEFNKIFNEIYEKQNQSRTFRTVNGLLEEFYKKSRSDILFTSSAANKVGVSSEQLFENPPNEILLTFSAENNSSEQLNVNDLYYKSRTIIDYGRQFMTIDSFANLYSLRKLSSDEYVVEEGVDELAKKCLIESKAKLLPNKEKVVKIKRKSTNLFKSIIVSIDKRRSYEREFDHVIVATPIAENLRMIKFADYEQYPGSGGEIKGKFQKTNLTIVQGKLKSNFFWNKSIDHRKSSTNLPEAVVFLNHGNLEFISKLKPTQHNIWKIQSADKLTEKEIEKIFYVKRILKNSTTIFGYPDYSSYKNYIKNDDRGFVLDDNLYYINCIEWAASSVEMSLIASKNIALIIAKDVNHKWKIWE